MSWQYEEVAVTDGMQQKLLALCAIPKIDWHVLAREAQRSSGIEGLLRGDLAERSKSAGVARLLIQAHSGDEDQRLASVRAECERARDAGAELITVLDDEYPINLRLTYNLPPFLFVRGELQAEDALSVCVVGTRQATSQGLDQAAEMAAQLIRSKVTVVAGLAKGIDTAAHEAALEGGGRTIAVIGTGILRCYPKENLELSDRIAERGALVSQFWPSSPPTQFSFPMRNVTMSGISQGTVVVEASSTSGAKMQARLALEHGKLVFLVRSLVTDQVWARGYLKRAGAFEIASAQEVLARLRTPQRLLELTSSRRQLALALSI